MTALPSLRRLLSGRAALVDAHRPAAMPDIPVVRRAELPVRRPDLRVAVILDPFSETAFAPEWQQITFNKGNWHDRLAGDPPDLLFVESAWQGNRGKWRYTMTAADAPREPLRDLVAWCRDRGVPTVFWNKEDPPNYDRFIDTARLFDWVFTVDADRLPAYRADLGHDRVGVLPFAAQPLVHNPVLPERAREHDVVFAGTFFAEKHPVRREQMATVLEPATAFGLHIYSRMQGDDERYQFPDRYAPHVVGSLPYERMLDAYKAYKVFLNVNSVVESPSTCARRVFELSACATPVVSGWSNGIETILGDRVAVVRTPQETTDVLTRYLHDPESRDRAAHRARRLVLAEHTYGHRVDTVLRAVGLPAPSTRTTATVVVPVGPGAPVDDLLAAAARQDVRDLQVVLAVHGLDGPDLAGRARRAGLPDVVVAAADRPGAGAAVAAALPAADGDVLAVLSAGHHYGPAYLSDLLQAYTFTDADLVGKGAHYVHDPRRGGVVLVDPHLEHRYTDRVHPGTLVLRRDAARQVWSAAAVSAAGAGIDAADAGDLLEACRRAGVGTYSTDRFEFAVTAAPAGPRRTGPLLPGPVPDAVEVR